MSSLLGFTSEACLEGALGISLFAVALDGVFFRFRHVRHVSRICFPDLPLCPRLGRVRARERLVHATLADAVGLCFGPSSYFQREFEGKRFSILIRTLGATQLSYGSKFLGHFVTSISIPGIQAF